MRLNRYKNRMKNRELNANNKKLNVLESFYPSFLMKKLKLNLFIDKNKNKNFYLDFKNRKDLRLFLYLNKKPIKNHIKS